jgi:hypothetical protein
LQKGVPLHLNKLESLFAKDDLPQVRLNWPTDPGEEIETDGQIDTRRTTGDQKSLLELSAQVN